tara:strand:+ start:43768 stop:44658 length:891 start_codon:yes stop_codon:yes gene_type:complete
MTETSDLKIIDSATRFLFDNADIRGETVSLDKAYRDIVGLHAYAPGVKLLIGEFLAASVLLSTTLKFEGKLILQARSEGEIPLLMVECDHDLNIRAIARGAQQARSQRFEQLLHNGHLAITIDPLRGKRYQGIVPLEGESLARCLDGYFEQSEQLGTRLWLSADDQQAGGLLLQQLPGQLTTDNGERQQQWEHACSLAATVTSEELLTLPAARLLYRLYHQDPVRLFDSRAVQFHCSCSAQRTRNALSALNPAEVAQLLEEQGSITMDCEFCNQQYRFSADDLTDILQAERERILH